MYEDFVQNYYYVVDPLHATKDSIRINTTTKEGYYFLDTANTSVFATPTLQPTNFIMPSPEIVRTNNVINKKTRWVFSFKTNKNPVPAGGYLIMNIPQNVLLTIKDSSIDVLSYDTNKIYPGFKYTLYSDRLSVQQILIPNFCDVTIGCPVGTGYTVMIDWIKNPISQIQVTSPIVLELRTKEGYLAETGITPSVKKLFSELIPVKIQNNQIRAIDPTPGKVTDYEFIFTADAEFAVTDSLIITLPSEINTNTATSRML